jgi:guanidinoacetate N-methyltransferase
MTRTIESRKAIGFPTERREWNAASAIFDDHTLRISGHPVMEDWEAAYMKTLAQIATTRGGTVLEVGYGMGISARAIQAHSIDGHVIIECHPDVISRCLRDFRASVEAGRLRLLTGFWDEITPLLKDECFDGILFDTYPMNAEELHANHFPFFREAYRLLKPGGVFTYYSDEAREFSPAHLVKLTEAGFRPSDIDGRICAVSPPPDCEYWRETTLLAPIIRKSL